MLDFILVFFKAFYYSMCNMALTHRPLCYYNATEFSVIEIKFRLLN